MKLTDKTIKTVIVGCDKESWNKPVLDALHAVTDYFSYHHYSAEANKGLYGPFEGERNLKKAITELKALIAAYPDEVTDFSPWYRFPARSGKIQIALDEWNIWDFVADETYGLLQTYNWRDALWTASVMNLILSTPEIGMANLAQSVNVIAPIIAEEKGSWFQTIAYPLRLYRKTMLGERLEISFDSPCIDGGAVGEMEAISVSAVKNEDGTIRIAMVNRDFEHDYEIVIDNCLEGCDNCLEAKGKMIVLTGIAPNAVCALENSCVQETVVEVKGKSVLLRAGSVNLLTLE